MAFDVNDLIKAMPVLKSFAIMLCHDQTWADDLVQDTCEKALRNSDKFEEGTKLRSWLFTILRYGFLTKNSSWERRNIVSRPPEELEMMQIQGDERDSQGDALYLAEISEFMQELRQQEADALTLTAVEGKSYAEAAQIMGCSIGTIKSRVSRARDHLEKIIAKRESIAKDRS